MTIEYAPLKFRPADKNLNIVLNDLREKLNEVIDSMNGASVTDKYVMVGASGAADYLSSLYFNRTIAGHITIKNSYTTTTPLTGGGDLSAARTLSITGLSTIGTANYIPGVNAAGSAWEYKQLAAGTGISIVHAANLITITAGLATTHNILSTHHADSTAASVVRGDIITGQGATPKWTRLATGTVGQFLKTNGTDPSWSDHGLTLDMIGNPAANKTFNCSNKSISFTFTNPTNQPTYDGAFEIQADGAFAGDLLHVHQHTGNPGVTDLVHLEASDVDVLPLRIESAATVGMTINKQIQSTLVSGTAPLVIASNTMVANLNSDLLDGYEASGFAVYNHTHAALYEPLISTGTTAQFWRGDKSWQTLNQAATADMKTSDNLRFATLTVGGAIGSVRGLNVAPITSAALGANVMVALNGFDRAVDVNESNDFQAVVISQYHADIASGVTDAGDRIGFISDCSINDANFQGTLANQIGIHVAAGVDAAGVSGARTITNVYALKLDCYAEGGGTVTNPWGIYQTGATYKNYFEGRIQSAIATGTSPFIIASTTVNANLNADLWDGYQFADYLDQAVKQASSPTFAKLTIASNEGHVATNSRASVSRNADQTISSGSDVVIQWDNENDDPGGDMTIASPYSYTTPVAGIYYIALNIVWNNPPSALYWASIRVGGNAVCEAITPHGGYVSNNCAILVSVNAGVAIDAIVHHTQGSDQTILGGQAYCNFSIALVQQNVA